MPKLSWRGSLPNTWRGSRPVQSKIPNFEYTTVMQVPSSLNSRLLNGLARAEYRVAKVTGYQCKMVEKGGKLLSNFFSKQLSNGKCPRLDCEVCANPDIKGSTLCNVSDVVYEASCTLCEQKFKENPSEGHKGRYIGETYRTLYERSLEHVSALRRFDSSSFMVKHWSSCHPLSDKPPEFRFKVVQKHKDALSRKIHEAVRISNCAALNSKSEWGRLKLSRLTVDKSEWEQKRDLVVTEKSKKQEIDAILTLFILGGGQICPP